MESESEVDSPIAFTARYVCGLRCVEGRTKDPLLIDPLSPLLCGSKGLALAEEELRNLRAAQGEGKHLRVPARNRCVDDEVVRAVATLAGMGHTRVQVLCLGCGLDSRPWRLSFPSTAQVSWFDIDFEEMIQLKECLLLKAGAQTRNSQVAVHTSNSGATPPQNVPLAVAAYHSVGLDLSKNAANELGPSLVAAGFEPGVPCVWVLEAVIYYMELGSACELLAALAELSMRGGVASTLVATCIDKELLVASQSMEPGSHVFAHLWYFDVVKLLSQPSYTQFWRTDMMPRTTKELAYERYNADTYVALYGGAECVFTAKLNVG